MPIKRVLVRAQVRDSARTQWLQFTAVPRIQEDALVTCEHCGRQVPEGLFCAVCGAHLGVGVDDAASRPHHYAAHPAEHVAHPSVFTTLFPHVGQAKIHEFRYAFLAGLVVIVILVATGIVVAALLAAILLLPALYLIYLYEAQVYGREPALVIGATFGGGVVLGVVVTIVAQQVIGVSVPRSGAGALGYSLILPLVQLVVMPIPALLLRGRDGFRPTVDGLVFGVASGLGFSVAEGIVRFSGVFSALGIHTDSASWIYPLVSLAALVPLLHGSTSGAISAALWRSDRVRTARSLGTWGIPVAVVAAVLFYYVGQTLTDHGISPLVVLLYQAIPIGALLVYIRFLLHHSLLEEAAGLGFHPIVCANCHRHVMAAGFCPHCGMAVDAAPRTTMSTPSAAPAPARAEGR